jgi:hypothetical protein
MILDKKAIVIKDFPFVKTTLTVSKIKKLPNMGSYSLWIFGAVNFNASKIFLLSSRGR